MDIPFSLKTQPDGNVVYRIHPLYRAFNGVIFALIALSIAIYAPTAIFGYIFALTALAGTLYEERWTFGLSEISYSSGFFPFCLIRKHALSDLKTIRIEAFAKGELDQSKAPGMLARMDGMPVKKNRFPGGIASRMRIRLVLDFADGQTFLVDETGPRSRNRLDALAATVSGITGIALEA